MKIKLQFGEEEYRITGVDVAGEVHEGELSPYGEAAVLEAAGSKYMAHCEKVGEEVESLLPDEEWVTVFSPVAAEIEDSDFEDDEDDDSRDLPAEVEIGEGEEEEEDDGDEEEEEAQAQARGVGSSRKAGV